MKRILVSLMLSSCLWIAGCEQGPKMVPAAGILTLKGAPLPDASILVMYPDGNSATGSSDKDGKFSLTYLGRNGALPGTDLKIAVSKQENLSPPSSSAAPTTTGSGPPKTVEEQEAIMKDAMKMMADLQKANEAKMKSGEAIAKDLIDAKYRRAETSGLKLTIPEGGSQELKIDVP